jgi:hypothetical protein
MTVDSAEGSLLWEAEMSCFSESSMLELLKWLALWTNAGAAGSVDMVISMSLIYCGTREKVKAG